MAGVGVGAGRAAGAGASGIFCLLDRRPEEFVCEAVFARLLSLAAFRFRACGVDAAAEEVVGADAGGVSEAWAAWLAAWRAEDLVILGDMSNLTSDNRVTQKPSSDTA